MLQTYPHVLFEGVTEVNDATDSYLDPAYQYTTQIINRVEVLWGYEEDREGEPLINKPIWKPMADDKLNIIGARGREYAQTAKFVCRSIPYVSEKYLVERNKNYDLPTYDEYFIMTE